MNGVARVVLGSDSDESISDDYSVRHSNIEADIRQGQAVSLHHDAAAYRQFQREMCLEYRCLLPRLITKHSLT